MLIVFQNSFDLEDAKCTVMTTRLLRTVGGPRLCIRIVVQSGLVHRSWNQQMETLQLGGVIHPLRTLPLRTITDPNKLTTDCSPIAEPHVSLYTHCCYCATIRMLHSIIACYFHKSKNVGLAEAEGAGDVVRVVHGEPQLLLGQVQIDCTVASVDVTYACLVLLATYQSLL